VHSVSALSSCLSLSTLDLLSSQQWFSVSLVAQQLALSLVRSKPALQLSALLLQLQALEQAWSPTLS